MRLARSRPWAPWVVMALVVVGLVVYAWVAESKCRRLTHEEKLVLPILFVDPDDATVCDLPPEFPQEFERNR
jgi:hypothetical protein